MLRFFMALGLLSLGLGQGVSLGATTTVIDNTSQAVNNNTFAPFVGQSFVDGPTASVLGSVTILGFSGYTPVTPVLELETRNSNGTVGSTLFSGFSESYNSSSHFLTFTASSSFTLPANVGYFLVLSDAGAAGATPSWNYTLSQTYNPQNGFTLPAANSSFMSLADNTVSGAGSTYFPLSGGPQMFSLTTTAAVPEPSSLVMALMGLIAVAAVLARRVIVKAVPSFGVRTQA